MEYKTKADKVVYTRVPSVKESINNHVISKLIEMGANEEDILIKVENDSEGCGCVKQVIVTAYTIEDYE